MTDEELWLKHIEEYPQIKSWSEEKREGAKKGFKSGLAEGKPKWHDLRKNPSDLPKKRERVLLCIEVARKKFENFKVYIEGIYDKGECLGEYDSCWLYQEADKKVLTEIIDNQRVIAWCEIPKFEV